MLAAQRTALRTTERRLVELQSLLAMLPWSTPTLSDSFFRAQTEVRTLHERVLDLLDSAEEESGVARLAEQVAALTRALEQLLPALWETLSLIS